MGRRKGSLGKKTLAKIEANKNKDAPVITAESQDKPEAPKEEAPILA